MKLSKKKELILKAVEYVNDIPARVEDFLIQERFTCSKCSSREICKYAFDDYNTNGDCLAVK